MTPIELIKLGISDIRDALTMDLPREQLENVIVTRTAMIERGLLKIKRPK